MIFRATPLPGAYIIEPEPFRDHRGFFARTFCRQEFAAIDHHQEFVQINHSRTQHKGTIRGLHYQRPPHAEAKLIRCIRGSVYDVIVDIRRNSRTFLQYISVELTERNMNMIYVPQGFAHGFQVLEAGTELIYHHTAYYAPESEGGIKYNDPLLGIKWPLPAEGLSAKDQAYPYLERHFSGVEIA